MKIALYARVSKDDGKMDTENQLIELRAFAAKQGWEAVEYVDRVTGTTNQRPQFRKLMEDASKRRFDLVLFWALDRFSREGVTETLNHLKRLDSWGVGWRSYTESYFDSTGPFKEAVVAIIAAVAKLERDKLSERTKAGLRRAVKQGKTLGRPSVNVNVGKVRKLQDAGMSLRNIAAETGWSLSSIMRALKAA